jgi:hypothetical protein
MKLNAENLRIAQLILHSWAGAYYLIKFSKPQEYLANGSFEEQGHQTLSVEDWTRVRKTVKGTRFISPLFRKKRKCLMEALIVSRGLAKNGIVTRLHIGARKEDQALSTHAWVTLEDKVLIGGPVEGYQELFRIR